MLHAKFQPDRTPRVAAAQGPVPDLLLWQTHSVLPNQFQLELQRDLVCSANTP